jgi:hypothetical protein
MSKPVTNVKLIGEIINGETLCIPSYQRPYTWQSKNVLQLLNDICSAITDQPVYRLGTLIFERDKEKLNIVDGQQRLITIAIILYECGDLTPGLLNAKFPHEQSQINIKANQLTVRSWLSELAREERSTFRAYLLHQCEAVTIELDDLSEAFQFFDSQNSRGKALDPTDLLKAFHLREMEGQEPAIKQSCADIWDDIGEAGLKSLIGIYLYRIRLWSRGKNASHFTKDDIDEFKGFSIETAPDYPYLATWKLNEQALILAEHKETTYPFQIPQLILNGRRFFEMIGHYHQLNKDLFSGEISPDLKDFHQHTHYPEEQRTGDQYTKILYKMAVLCYFDRFGRAALEQNYPLLFMWAYKPRIQNKSVRYRTSNAYVHDTGNNIFRIMLETFDPKTLAVIKPRLRLMREEQNIPTVKQVFTEHHLAIPRPNVS